MGRYDENGPQLPPRVKAAMDFLHHTRMITEQSDASIPARSLTPLEKSVETAALRAVQQYLMGEMEFAEDAAPSRPSKKNGDDDTVQPVPSAS